MCCVLAGCDYFRLRGVALETALKLFRPFMQLRTGLPLSADTVAQCVFDELLKMGKLKKEDMEAIISDYLLADACFQFSSWSIPACLHNARHLSNCLFFQCD